MSKVIKKKLRPDYRDAYHQIKLLGRRSSVKGYDKVLEVISLSPSKSLMGHQFHRSRSLYDIIARNITGRYAASDKTHSLMR